MSTKYTYFLFKIFYLRAFWSQDGGRKSRIWPRVLIDYTYTYLWGQLDIHANKEVYKYKYYKYTTRQFNVGYKLYTIRYNEQARETMREIMSIVDDQKAVFNQHSIASHCGLILYWEYHVCATEINFLIFLQ